MSDPATLDEYNALYLANSRIAGYGPEAHSVLPCPACCAPNFVTLWIAGGTPFKPDEPSPEEAMKRERTCTACGRAFKAVFSVDRPNAKQFGMVQTAGPDLPPYLPTMPRAEAAQ